MKRTSFLASLLILPLSKLLARNKNPMLANACRTQRDQEGPYYKAGAPSRSVIETNGERVTIEGTIINSSDCSTPVSNAVIDLWHCDSEGNYDNKGFKCRGMVKSDSKGKYSFTTIFPPSYGGRPRHIHFKVRADGFNELTSQIYFKGDDRLGKDFSRDAEASRVIMLDRSGDAVRGHFDIYI